VVGGGATSDVWCQIFADILGIPIRQLESPIQANAVGAAFIGYVGTGAIFYSDIPNLTHIRHTYLPDSGKKAVYDELFETFKLAYRCLAPLYRRLNVPGKGKS
jgi:xylulokinase